jgi:hypothetical protein
MSVRIQAAKIDIQLGGFLIKIFEHQCAYSLGVCIAYILLFYYLFFSNNSLIGITN